MSQSQNYRSQTWKESVRRFIVRFAEWAGWLVDFDEKIVNRYLHPELNQKAKFSSLSRV